MSKESVLVGGASGDRDEATHVAEPLLTTSGLDDRAFAFLAEIAGVDYSAGTR